MCVIGQPSRDASGPKIAGENIWKAAGRWGAPGAVAVPRYCAEADVAPCGLLPCEVGPGAGNGRLGGRGAPPSEATKDRNTELFFSASWPAEMTMSTCSGGSLKEVSTALRAAARCGSS